MPDLRGIDSASALKVLSDARLEVSGVDHQFSAVEPRSYVVIQTPAPGEEVKHRRRVHLTLSLGQELIRIPDLRELSPSQAGDTLQRLGLRLGDTHEVFGAGMTPGTIIGTTPRAGKKAPRGSMVDITISQNSMTGQTYVPDFQNMSLESARRLLAKYSLRLRQVFPKGTPDLVPGTVLSQSVKAGSRVDKETFIDLTVSE